MSRDRKRYTDDPIPAREGYYDDYWQDRPKKPAAPLSEDQREAYYAQKDAYYAQRDEYYARRDAYYASLEDRGGEDRDDEEAYYEEDGYVPGRAADRPRRRKRRRRKGRVLRTLILLLLIAAVAALLLGQAPVYNPTEGTRRISHSTVLLAGTDRDGFRTDTIMLLSLNRSGGDVRLLSIPRDTYDPYYTVPKINSAYGAGGVNELMRSAADILGFAPDAYLVVDLEFFVRAVDLLGGLDYDVPTDMYYVDESQDLHIDLKAGPQHLNGEQVMELVRFRSGYANADIGRTEVQREFLKTALSQWLRPSSLPALPALWELYRSNAKSDLTPRNLLWILRVLIKTDPDDIAAELLPGYPDMAGEWSVYVTDREAAAAMLKNYSPYI